MSVAYGSTQETIQNELYNNIAMISKVIAYIKEYEGDWVLADDNVEWSRVVSIKTTGLKNKMVIS